MRPDSTTARVRRIRFACVVVACIGGCSSPGRRDLDAAIDVRDSMSEAVDPGSVEALDVPRADDSGAEIVMTCTPGAQECVKGWRRKCSDVGEWAAAPCPAGEVCERGACAPNVAYVTIVVDNIARARDVASALTDPALAQAADAASCASNDACCADLDSRGLAGTLAPARLAKYWVRRLATDLGTSGVRFTLLHPPAVESGDPRTPCDPSAGSLAPESCAGRYYTIEDEARATVEMGAALGVDYATLDPGWGSPWFPARIPTGGPALDAARTLVTRMMSAGPSADTSEILGWVDEVEQTEATGAQCLIDADCPGGFCREGLCLRHVNPELPFWPVDGRRPLSWFAYLALGVAGTAEGDGCGTDADCRIREYRCGPDGKCHDEARHCRRRHVVLLSTFTPSFPGWAPDCLWPEDVDPSLWSHWLRWGCGCRSPSNCAAGAACIDSGTCNYSEQSGGYDCWKFNECMPSDLDAVLKSGPPYAPYGDLYSSFHAACTGFPTMSPLDRNEEVIRATVHSIVTYQPDLPHAADGLATAAGAAIIGGGTFVTPCRPGTAAGWTGGVRSCDFVAQYQALLDAIRKDLADSVCGEE